MSEPSDTTTADLCICPLNGQSMSQYKTSKSRLESARAWKLKNADRMKSVNNARNAAIRADPEAWAKKLEYNKESAKRRREQRRDYDRNRDPLKKWARAKLRTNVARGKIVKLPCEKCGNQKSEGHHEDYSKPLEVIWLCRKCHKDLHDHQAVAEHPTLAPTGKEQG